MTPQTKKILLIGGSLLAIAFGIAIYSHKKNKPDSGDASNEGDNNKEGNTDIGSQTETSSTSNVKPLNPSNLGVAYKPNVESNKESVIVKLDDVLAGGLKSANGKKIYSVIDGLKFYNLEGKEAGKAIKNKLLGNIAVVTQDSKGTKMVYFLGTNGVKYKMPSVGLNVAI